MNKAFIGTFLLAGGGQVVLYFVLLLVGVVRNTDAPLAKLYVTVYGFRPLNATLEWMGAAGVSRTVLLLLGFLLVMAVYSAVIALLVSLITACLSSI